MLSPSQPKSPDNELRGFCVRRTPRACHGACDRLRPGSLRASHAVCLCCSTLAPVFCARKEGADIESVSTTESILAESLAMQGSLSPTHAVPIGLYATSRHCIPRLSPRNSNPAKRLTMALQRTAPRVTVAAILVRESLVRATFFRSSYALSSLHPRSYRAALRSL